MPTQAISPLSAISLSGSVDSGVVSDPGYEKSQFEENVASTATSYRFGHTERCNLCDAGPEQQVFLGRRLDRPQGLWPRRKPGITTSIFRCRTCRLVYPNPMPLPLRLEQHYDVAPEEYWTTPYFEVDPTYNSVLLSTFTRLYHRSPLGCTALDIGAGIGKGMVALSAAGFDVTGIEPSPSFRRAAIERLKIPEDRLLLDSVESAQFPPNSFDFINLAAVLEHFADPAETLRKVTHWLKPGGLAYVEVPSSAYLLSRAVRLFYRMTGADFVVHTCPMHAPYHLYEFGLESFVRHGQRTGYATAFHEYFPCTGFLPRWLARPLDAIMRWTGTGMQLAVWLRKDDDATASCCP